MSGYISNSWNMILDQSFEPEKQDIYFTEEYFEQNKVEGSTKECFIYSKGPCFFIFPYLRTPIPTALGAGLFDIQSPYGYSGPLSNCSDKSFLSEAQVAFKEAMKASNVIAGFIRFHPLIENQNYFTIDGTQFDRKTVSINTSLSADEIWTKEIHSKNRNMIRKGINADLSFVIDENMDRLDEFLQIYFANMNRLNASEFYFFNEKYFKGIREKSFGKMFLGLILKSDIVISGAIFFEGPVFSHYHLAANNEDYRDLAPNNFLLYSAALEFNSRGMSKLHLGGGRSTREDDELFKFKQKFSSTSHNYFIGKYIFLDDKYANVCGLWAESCGESAKLFNHQHLKYRS